MAEILGRAWKHHWPIIVVRRLSLGHDTLTLGQVILDYRLPDTGAHRIRKIANALETEQVMAWGLHGVQFLVGIAGCFIIPLIAAGLFRRSALSTTAFFVASYLTIPVLLWLTRPRNGGYLWEEVESAATSGKPITVTRPFPLGPLTINPMAFLMLLLLGPKLIWSAIEGWRQHAPTTLEQRIVCARIAAQLLDADGSQPLWMLRPIDPDRKVVETALKYLEMRGWLFISAQRDRVSLAGSIRKELANLA